MSTNPQRVYKVCPEIDWISARAAGYHHGSADDRRDGFIHLSTREQLAGTLAKHYRGQRDLLLVAFDAGALAPGLQWEPSRGGALFPHLYGPLPAGAALAVTPLALGSDGVPQLPEEF